MSEPILALDQSLSSTGWCLYAEGEDPVSGSWPLASSAKKRAEGFRELWGHLDKMHKLHGFAELVHERPSFGAVNQGEDQLIGAVGLIGVIELFCCARSIEIRSHSVQSWRTTWFLKHERKAIAAKPQKVRDWKRPALERAEQYGFAVASHDEAEAIAILDHDLLTRRITPPWRFDEIALHSVA